MKKYWHNNNMNLKIYLKFDIVLMTIKIKDFDFNNILLEENIS